MSARFISESVSSSISPITALNGRERNETSMKSKTSMGKSWTLLMSRDKVIMRPCDY